MPLAAGRWLLSPPQSSVSIIYTPSSRYTSNHTVPAPAVLCIVVGIQQASATAKMFPPEPEPDIPGRRDFIGRFVQDRRPVPPSAVPAFLMARERHATATTQPNDDYISVYMPESSPESKYRARCFAYAYIVTAASAPKPANDPTPIIRDAIHAVLPGLEFILSPPSHGADRADRFASPDDREAAMEKQPFALTLPGDGAAASVVKLVREGETSNCFQSPLNWLAHVALHFYPKEQRSEEEIQLNCMTFGYVLEVDPACYVDDVDDATPDMTTVRVVLNMYHPREILREVRIRYPSDYRFWNVVPVQIIRVWDKSLSLDAHGDVRPGLDMEAATCKSELDAMLLLVRKPLWFIASPVAATTLAPIGIDLRRSRIRLIQQDTMEEKSRMPGEGHQLKEKQRSKLIGKEKIANTTEEGSGNQARNQADQGQIQRGASYGQAELYDEFNEDNTIGVRCSYTHLMQQILQTPQARYDSSQDGMDTLTSLFEFPTAFQDSIETTSAADQQTYGQLYDGVEQMLQDSIETTSAAGQQTYRELHDDVQQRLQVGRVNKSGITDDADNLNNNPWSLELENGKHQEIVTHTAKSAIPVEQDVAPDEQHPPPQDATHDAGGHET
uniref:DUF4283 domain-containing protein n=1 Tax=Leersia perrieri TaxID=77586 RepID=A0A0D9V8U5_9ORYZ